ncbi:hypothetical protein Agabi119p4_5925 [Agaricus bisporus var. burnettii]|uniref:Uncharacterized protein n=1 Tax=Agaricus bisporus var. burnettii TaxID=192524 RepID=A0A8H7KG08_AGABI|nr:hypothetical protein Agabi119p4_5925 [Agaricus bisporus var. burnettii]
MILPPPWCQPIRQMYSINQPLYRISMALRYREASIGKLQGAGSRGTARCAAIAKNFRLRNNVHSLSFKVTRLSFDYESENGTHVTDAAMKRISNSAFVKLAVSHWRSKAQPPTPSIAPQFPPSNPASGSVTIGRSLTLSRQKTREQVARDGITAALREFLSSLPNLTNLDIHFPNSICPSSDENDSTIVLLQPPGNETPYDTTLKSLTITGSVVAWKQLIPHHYEWPRLETFRVRIDSGHENPNDDVYAIRLILAPFIRRHSKTLKMLSIGSKIDQDLTSLYDGIGCLLHLETLEIEQPSFTPSKNHTEALGQFLIRHRDNLTSFRWTFVTPSNVAASQTFILHPQEWFEQPPYNLQLPRLRQMALTLPGTSNLSFFEGTNLYCARHASTLTHLSLNGLIMSLTQFRELLLLIGSKRLESLEISLEVLTSAVLINLSTKCPSLQCLHLAYSSVGRQKSLTEPVLVDPTAGGILKIPNVPMVNTWQFRHDMSVLVLGNWNVGELYLRKVGDRSWEEYKMDQVGRLIVKSLPRVEFVNGSYREDYV